MNIAEILQNSEQIAQFVPKIKSFIPTLVENQKAFALKKNLQAGEFLMYSVLLSPSGKVFLYCFRAESAKENFSIGESKFSKGCVIIKEELFKIELTQYLDVVEKQGLMGLMQMLPMDSLMGFKM